MKKSIKALRDLLLRGFIFALVLVTIQACGSDDDPVTPPEEEPGNIVEVAQSDDDFSSLVDALSDAELGDDLEADGPFTVFAPTNEAFSNLPDGLLDDLTNEQLIQILTYHVLDSEVASGDLDSQQAVEALAAEDLFITADGEVVVNDLATVVEADIEASNGIIHAVDEVLLPDAFLDVVGIVAKRYNLQAAEDAAGLAGLVETLKEETENGYTVFAPTNAAFEDAADPSELSQEELQGILSYHVLPNEVLSGDLDEAQTVTTLNDEELVIEAVDGTVTLTDQAGQTYEVVEADLQGTNGVVHIIDGVLDPRPNIVDAAAADGNFDTLVGAIEDAGLTSTLSNDGPFTVFAPVDEAFEALPAGTIDNLSQDELEEVLSYHVLESPVLSDDLDPEQAVGALAGGDLFITADGDVVINDLATVIDADIRVANGVIHAVDRVLLPDAYATVVEVVTKRFNLQQLEDALVDADLVETLQGDGPFTVFAPTNDAFDEVDTSGLSQQELQDILTYHVLDDEVLSGDIESGMVTTVNGAELEIDVDSEGNVSLTDQAGNTYSVTTVDLQGTNGVVHIIDGVLLPSE